MRNLSARANVIPVIAKADTLTSQELQVNKEAIMRDITHFNIPIYYFPCDDEDDDETIQECMALRELVPFAVVGGNEIFHMNDEYFRGREYPWGFVRVDDPDQSDFAALRAVLFGSHLTEFREITHDILYEKYRTEKLSAKDGSVPFSPDINVDENMLLGGGPHAALQGENKRKEYEENLQRQLEQKRQEVNRHEEYLRQIKAATLPRKE